MIKFVAYRRVSTDEQGRSGLGLEAQEAAILAHVKAQGGTLVGDFIEVQSGGDDDRPELLKARKAAQKHKAVMIVSKLDRLSRDLAYIATFLKGEKGKPIDFVVCDMPQADRPMLQIMGWFAEMERTRISTRTREALQAKKARGEKLGGTNLDLARANSAAKRSAKAEEGRVRVRLLIGDLKAQGITTLKGIATALNERGIATSQGGAWSATQVSRVIG